MTGVALNRQFEQVRANGIGQDEIIARLRENPTTGQQEPLGRATIAASVLSGENTQLAPLESIVAASVGKVDAMADKITDLDRRIERMEQRRNTWLRPVLRLVVRAHHLLDQFFDQARCGVLLVVAIVVILRMYGN